MIQAVPCGREEARVLLAASLSHKADQEGRFDLGELLNQGSAFKVLGPGGEAVAAYVLAANGPLLWIVAAAGRAGFDLTSAIDALVVAQGREFRQVGFRTERAGLVRKTRRLGYQVTRREGRAYFLRKNIAP